MCFFHQEEQREDCPATQAGSFQPDSSHQRRGALQVPFLNTPPKSLSLLQSSVPLKYILRTAFKHLKIVLLCRISPSVQSLKRMKAAMDAGLFDQGLSS